MKKQLVMICLIVLVGVSFLAGCSPESLPIQDANLKSVEPVGQVPNEFKKVIENNVFEGAIAFDGRLLKSETCTDDKGNKNVTHRVWMMDTYGKTLAEYECSSDDAYHITTLTATADGGFLFVLGFRDYAYDQNLFASDKGFASRVIKCDKYGNLQFDTPFDSVEENALEYCFEKDGNFYLFGDLQTPETKIRGVYSKTDIYMTVLDENGKVLKSRYIAGSDYDNLVSAEISSDGFILSISAQSDDGDFAGSNSNGYPVDWVITVNDNFEITGKQKETYRDYSDYIVGEKDGALLYNSDTFFDSFDAGNPQAFIDYGDFYLIVSKNYTGIYENTPPMISSVWYYTETVYSAYDYNGKLIFRAAVDSSPDFDALVYEFEIG